MALTYDYTKVEGVDKFTDEQHENASQLAWTLLTLQLREISQENLNEILFRIKFLEEINVKLFQEKHDIDSVKKFMTDHINYKTNVSNETRYKFITHWAKVKASIAEDNLKFKGVN